EEVNHAVRHHHDKDGVEAEAMLGAVDHEAAEEEFEADELHPIREFPDPETRPQRLSRFDLVEGIRLLEVAAVGDDEQDRQHDGGGEQDPDHLPIDTARLFSGEEGTILPVDALPGFDEEGVPESSEEVCHGGLASSGYVSRCCTEPAAGVTRHPRSTGRS